MIWQKGEIPGTIGSGGAPPEAIIPNQNRTIGNIVKGTVNGNGRVIPLIRDEKEIDPFLDIEKEINRLRKKMNAVILAHYYQEAELQDIADFVCDSLDLSRKAASTDADVIIFCGVTFMADVVKILNPKKTVVVPDMDAGCSFEQACPPQIFHRFRETKPDNQALT